LATKTDLSFVVGLARRKKGQKEEGIMSLSAQKSFVGTGLLAQTNTSFANESVESNENWTSVKLNWTSVNFVLVEGVGLDGQACFLGHGCEMFAAFGKHFVFVAEEKRGRGKGKN
jgi:hypothetical protein